VLRETKEIWNFVGQSESATRIEVEALGFQSTVLRRARILICADIKANSSASMWIQGASDAIMRGYQRERNGCTYQTEKTHSRSQHLHPGAVHSSASVFTEESRCRTHYTSNRQNAKELQTSEDLAMDP